MESSADVESRPASIDLHGYHPNSIQSLIPKLIQEAYEGNAAAQIFYLKARAGWTERMEISGRDGGPITLAAMREAFAAEIESTATKTKPRQITDESE